MIATGANLRENSDSLGPITRFLELGSTLLEGVPMPTISRTPSALGGRVPVFAVALSMTGGRDIGLDRVV